MNNSTDVSHEEFGLTARQFSKNKLLAFSDETLAVSRVVPIGKETGCVMPSATGFFLRANERNLFVTNKHVVTARDFFRPDIHLFHGATPEKLVLSCFAVSNLPNGKRFFMDVLYELPLFDASGNQRFFCPNSIGDTDIAVFDLGQPTFDLGFSSITNTYTGNASFQFLTPSPLPFRVMDSVIIVGYPETGIFRETGFSVFKSGIVASEPDLDFRGGLVLIDANTKSGMSGSPVLHKPPNIFEANSGVVGIYSGRDEDGRVTGNAELGLMWPVQAILDQIDQIPRNR